MAGLVMGGRGVGDVPHQGRLAWMMTVLLLLCGCADGASSGGHDFTGVKSVTFNGQKLPPAAGLDALRHTVADILSHIPPSSTPIQGSAAIVIPDYDRVRVLAAQAVKPPVEGAINLYAAQNEINLRADADDIVKGQVFRTAAIVQQNDTAMPDAGGADYLLWYQVASVRPNNAGPWIGRWVLKRPGDAAQYVVNADPGTAIGSARVASFLKAVQLAAAGGVPAAIPLGVPHAAMIGSGIVVDAQGHVLTNNHVAANCPDVRVAGAGGAGGPASIVAADAANDLLLLKVERRWPAWAKFRDSYGLRPGEPVVVTGFPLTSLVSSEMAVTTGSVTATAGLQGDTRQLMFSAPIQSGNSGGPVLDEGGRVVGIATGTVNNAAMAAVGAITENANYAVKSDTAREFLDANHVSLDQGAGRGGLSAPAIGDLARKFTVKVECWR